MKCIADNYNGRKTQGASFIPIPALALPLNVGVFITAHSNVPFTPVISAHTCTDPAVSFTLSISVTIWTAAVSTASIMWKSATSFVQIHYDITSSSLVAEFTIHVSDILVIDDKHNAHLPI